MSPESDVVRNAYKALELGDIAYLHDLVSEDVVWHSRGWGPHAGDYRGRDAVAALVAKFTQMTEGTARFEVESFLEDGTRTVVIIATTHEQPRRLSSKHIDIWDLRDGKLVDFWSIQADHEAKARA